MPNGTFDSGAGSMQRAGRALRLHAPRILG
jgi:hypothetical protein